MKKTIEILWDYFRFSSDVVESDEDESEIFRLSPEDVAELTELANAFDDDIDAIIARQSGAKQAIPVTASMVSELRDREGAGLMECKRVLDECAGDIDAAADVLYRRRRSG